jgi:hypothetical protein
LWTESVTSCHTGEQPRHKQYFGLDPGRALGVIFGVGTLWLLIVNGLMLG